MTVVARVEHVGSLLRPGFLRIAREAHARGELAPAGLKAAEDRAVREVVAMQEVRDEARRREIDLVVLPTAEAINEVAKAAEDTNAILHLTC